MSTIIAIEASCDIASVALLHKQRILTDQREGFSTHSLHLLPMLHALLERENLTLEQCDGIAFGCGPGSFTGVRTACGIVQGIAFARALPVMPVVGLKAMAQICYEQSEHTNVLSVIDARMHEVYWAQYQLENGVWQTIHEPCLSSIDAIRYTDHPVFCGNALSAYRDEMASVVAHNDCYEHIMPHASAVLKLGFEDFSSKNTISARQIEPLYLRNKVALKTKERLALKANS